MKKRWIGIGNCLVAVLMCGCSQTPSKAASEIAALMEEGKNVESQLSDVCVDLSDTTKAFSKAYLDATDGSSTYDLTAFVTFNRESIVKLDALEENTAQMKQTVSEMGMPSGEKDLAIYEAAEDYCECLLEAIDGARTTVAFYLAQNTAATPLNEISSPAVVQSYNGDQLGYAEAMYRAAGNTYDNFTKLEVPDYIDGTWQPYTAELKAFMKMIQSSYEGIAGGDVLKMYSGLQLLSRESIVIAQYDTVLFELYGRIYDRTDERVKDEISTIRTEIEAACKENKSNVLVYKDRESQVKMDYKIIDEIYPNLYHSLDSAINLFAYTDTGSKEVLITAEIAGFSQKYEQTVTLNPEVTRILIKPPVLTQMPDLSTAKETLLTFSVTDQETGKTLEKESKTITCYSIYDFVMFDNEFGNIRMDDLLAWLTPESDSILTLRRNAITWLEENTSFTSVSLPGYQNGFGFSEDQLYLNTYMQVLALQGAISDMGVRYNMGPYSLNASQRVLMPDDVLSSRSGICIETAILMATALQSADMHPMIVLTPGHAQVAVESWSNSGQYFLIETTLLPFTATADNIDKLIVYLDSEGWQKYLSGKAENGTIYIIDCDLNKILDIKGLSYD